MIDHPQDDIEDTPAPLWSTIVARSIPASSITTKGFSQTTGAKSGGFHPAAPKSRASNRFAALQVPESDQELLSPDTGVEPATCELGHPVDRERIWRTYYANTSKADRRTGFASPGYSPSMSATNESMQGRMYTLAQIVHEPVKRTIEQTVRAARTPLEEAATNVGPPRWAQSHRGCSTCC